jgi:hypothetical protein
MEQTSKELTIGAFFPCYNEKKAVLYSIERLYTIYENIPCYLVSDGGDDFSFLEGRFQNLKYERDENKRGKVTKLDHHIEGLDREKYAEDAIYSFLDRIKRAIEHCKTDYIIVMEPDVLVNGKLNIPNGSILLGTLINPFEEPGIHNLISEYGGKPFNRYGATPAIFRSKEFMEVYEFILANNDFIRRACEILPPVAYSDILLPLIFSLKGHSETFNPDIVECMRNPGWRDQNKPLVHQFRNYY